MGPFGSWWPSYVLGECLLNFTLPTDHQGILENEGSVAVSQGWVLPLAFLESSQVKPLLLRDQDQELRGMGPLPSGGRECGDGLDLQPSALKEFFTRGSMVLRISVISVCGWREHRKALNKGESVKKWKTPFSCLSGLWIHLLFRGMRYLGSVPKDPHQRGSGN